MQNPVTVEHRASPLGSVTSHRTSLRGSSVFDDESESHGTIGVLVRRPESHGNFVENTSRKARAETFDLSLINLSRVFGEVINAL